MRSASMEKVSGSVNRGFSHDLSVTGAARVQLLAITGQKRRPQENIKPALPRIFICTESWVLIL